MQKVVFKRGCSIMLSCKDARVKYGREGNHLKTLLIPLAWFSVTS